MIFLFTEKAPIIHNPSSTEISKASQVSKGKMSTYIVFTYTTSPKDNQLGRVLKETQVNEEEAVCLGLYQLRKVPEIKETKRRARHV